MEEERKWRYGKNRWVVILFIILNVLAARWYAPVLPHIQLPAEVVGHIGGLPIYNTFIAMLIADIILLLIAFTVNRAVSSGELVPRGLAGAVEALLEVIYNLTESTAGKWTRTIFPFFATITLMVLVVNWTELIPGVDSIGVIHEVHEGVEGHAVEQLAPGLATVTSEEGHFVLVPFVRVLSTDLNFTVGLALVSVIMTQVLGFRALGIGYFSKFLNLRALVDALVNIRIMGLLDFAVGILELISEIAKIISFAFRLFGNIFAGSVLLFVIGTLVPVFVQSFFLGLEFFVGAIQAFVFGMLTMVFMTQATQGHGEHHEEEHPVHAPEAV